MPFERIEFSKGPVTRITLNQPAKKNVLGVQTMREIRAALEEVREDDGAACIVVDANGSDFSGGHDLLAHAEITGKRRPWREEESRKYVEYMTREW
jgi:enoyl-CoA hydratase/carnithine racemase